MGRAVLKNLYGEKRVERTQQEVNAILDSHERFVAYRGGKRAQLGLTTLSDFTFANRNLKEADFAGAALIGASFYGSNLERASFYCADLQHSDLRKTNMQFADLRGASLKGADLSHANLDNADLRAAMMMFITPDGKSSILDRKAGSGPQGVDFSNCSLKKATFGNAKLDDAKFDGALLQGAVFKGARLANASFAGAVLTGVNLKELNVPPEALKDCVTDVSPETIKAFDQMRARLDGHQEWIVSGGAQGKHCVFDGEDMRLLTKLVVGRPLTGLSARGAIAIGLNFSGCQLQGARFDGTDLRDCDFTGADLRGASFRDAKISHARFDKADIRNLLLNSGNTRPTDFTGAQVTNDQFAAALREEGAILGLAGQPAAAATA